ncbi:hypothetical protein H0H92_013312 [Tricholoma furcatifolium]|nr:hypothetical protein H0H92_013312 [Tricholoma furcatifolium]
MPRGQRIHRLPQRLDYTLIPAPLDLSLPLVAERSPLPAIIVTPSSPSSSHDFSIAFLAAQKEPEPTKPSVMQRLSTSTKSYSFPLSIRAMIIVFLIIFVLVCHVVTHSLASRRPRLEFSVQTGEAHIVDTSINWFDFRSVLGVDTPEPKDQSFPPTDSANHPIS